MKFHYTNHRTGTKNTLHPDLVQLIRSHLLQWGYTRDWTPWQIQDCLLAFRTPSPQGNQLFLTHLEPIFLYLTLHGNIWDETQSECRCCSDVMERRAGLLSEVQEPALKGETE